jgi:phage major head subunit gpT-like protein
MSAFKNDEGVPLGIQGTHLVVPPSLEEEGTLLVKVPTLANGAGNPWYNTAELLVVPWLA